jgi:hypothetical protein
MKAAFHLPADVLSRGPTEIGTSQLVRKWLAGQAPNVGQW